MIRGDGGSLVRTSIGEENAQGQLDRPLKAIRRVLGCWALVAVGWLNYLEKMAELLPMIDIHGFNSPLLCLILRVVSTIHIGFCARRNRA